MFSEYPFKNATNLGAKLVDRPLVVDDVIGSGFLLSQRRLPSLPTSQLIQIPTPRFPQTPHTLGVACLDENDCITRAVEVAFKKKRGIKYDGPDIRIPSAA